VRSGQARAPVFAILLHYDRHFDAIARVTGQPGEWIARRGSLD
jgi:hypothetical protein